jgi:DNA-damage-inducible protein D
MGVCDVTRFHITGKRMSEITESAEYRNTIARLEEIKHATEDGAEYWHAREIHPILGYEVWDKFLPVIDRARDALAGNKIEPSHHIAQTSKMLGIGSGAMREVLDFYLSRAACSLIALNGDPSKPEIAAAQAYFVAQTRRMEMEDQRVRDEKRLEMRGKVAQSHRVVSGAAQQAGVAGKMQGVFHDARYQGLYGMTAAQVKRKKGLKDSEQLYDRAGAMELSMHDFQMNLAAEALKNEKVRGEQRAIRRNKEIAQEVRRVVINETKKYPESLPVEEPIREVKKRVERQKKLGGPKA